MKRKQSQALLPDAVMDNIDSVAAFYEREEAKISGTQSAIEELSGHFGSPVYFGGFIAFVFCWAIANLTAQRFGWPQFDPPPFIWLQGIVGVNGVLITIAVLIRQNRMARVAELRAHLSLQISLLSEQKTSKVIQLLEELRHDSPGVKDRHDPEVETMKMQTDPHAMLHAIDTQKNGKEEK
jgi:uncharacterized membrane protein